MNGYLNIQNNVYITEFRFCTEDVNNITEIRIYIKKKQNFVAR